VVKLTLYDALSARDLAMSRKNRKLKNFLVTPRFQLKLSLFFIVSGLLFLMVIVGFTFNNVNEVTQLMNMNPIMDFSTQNRVNDLMFQIVQVCLAGFVLYMIFSFLFALVISHRIAGPVVAIVAYIRALQEGDYDYQRNLRPGDEFKEIMDELHKLKPIMQERERQAEQSAD